MAAQKKTSRMWYFRVRKGDWTVPKMQHALYANSAYGLIVDGGCEMRGQIMWYSRRSRKIMEAVLPGCLAAPLREKKKYADERAAVLRDAESFGEWGWPPGAAIEEKDRLKMLFSLGGWATNGKRPKDNCPHCGSAWVLNGEDVIMPVHDGQCH